MRRTCQAASRSHAPARRLCVPPRRARPTPNSLGLPASNGAHTGTNKQAVAVGAVLDVVRCASCVAAPASRCSEAEITPAADGVLPREARREPAAKAGGIWKQTLVNDVAAPVRCSALPCAVRASRPNCPLQTLSTGAALGAFAERKVQEERCAAGLAAK